VTFGLDLSPDALNRVVEAITDRTLIIPLLEIDGNSKIALLELKLPSIVDNGTIVVPAELIVLGAKFACNLVFAIAPTVAREITFPFSPQRGQKMTFF
jgi:hypothetical protein